MKQDVVEFYESKGLDIGKLIDKRPLGTTPAQIKQAAAQVYDECQTRRIQDIQIARTVFRVASAVDGKKFAEDNRIIEEGKKVLAEVRAQKHRTLRILKDHNKRKCLELETTLDNVSDSYEKATRLLSSTQKQFAMTKSVLDVVIKDTKRQKEVLFNRAVQLAASWLLFATYLLMWHMGW